MTAHLAYSFRSIHEELERAVADYLAISRGSHLYADADAHAVAEAKAWERMMGMRERAESDSSPQTTPAEGATA